MYFYDLKKQTDGQTEQLAAKLLELAIELFDQLNKNPRSKFKCWAFEHSLDGFSR